MNCCALQSDFSLVGIWYNCVFTDISVCLSVCLYAIVWCEPCEVCPSVCASDFVCLYVSALWVRVMLLNVFSWNFVFFCILNRCCSSGSLWHLFYNLSSKFLHTHVMISQDFLTWSNDRHWRVKGKWGEAYPTGNRTLCKQLFNNECKVLFCKHCITFVNWNW